MKKLRVLRVALLLSFVVSLTLGIVMIRNMSAARDSAYRATASVARYALADRTLQLNLLNARAGLLRNYDPVNADLLAERESIVDIGRLRLRPQARAILDRLIVLGDRQEVLVERFKSDNALLQNSLARFAASENTNASTDNLLSARIFKLTLDTSPQTVSEAKASLNLVPQPQQGTGPAQFLSHARLLVAVLPEIDSLLNAIRAMRMENQIEALRLEVNKDADDDLRAIHWLQVVLVTALLVFLANGIALALLHRRRTRDLITRAENERLSAAIAMPLIDTGPENFAARVQEAIDQLALHIGAKHLQLLIPDSPNATLFSWPDGSLGARWLRSFDDAADADGAWKGDRVIATCKEARTQSTLGRAMHDSGLETLVLLRATEPHRVVIGIEPKDRTFAQRGDHLAAVVSVIVAIAHGARREAMRVERERLGRTQARTRRMEMIGAMASGVAHNFNNIIAAIGGFAEIGQDHTRNGSTARYNFDEIRGAVDRSRDLVDDILNFAKHGRSTKQPINLLTVLTQTIRLLSASARHEGTFQLSAPETLHAVMGAGSDLQQVFLNIANNASQASDGGPVRLSLDRAELTENRPMSHGNLYPGRYIVVSIRDAGPGIMESVRKRLFNPFFTTKAGGTGLGLSTAWEIIRDHGGTIDVTNIPGGGAQFTVWLPETHVDLGVPVVGDGARILLVADPERLAEDEELLAEIGFEPLGFASTTDPLVIRSAIRDCDAIVIAVPHALTAERLADEIGVASVGRPVFFAIPEEDRSRYAQSRLTLPYPLQSDEVSRLLVETLAKRVSIEA